MQVSFVDPLPDGAAAQPFGSQTSEKRGAQRRRVLLSAVVVNREFNAIFRCQVRDVSESGARLNVPESFLVPAGFWLIAVSSALAYEAKLAWRRYPEVGVALGGPVDLHEPATRIGRQLRGVWLSVVS